MCCFYFENSFFFCFLCGLLIISLGIVLNKTLIFHWITNPLKLLAFFCVPCLHLSTSHPWFSLEIYQHTFNHLDCNTLHFPSVHLSLPSFLPFTQIMSDSVKPFWHQTYHIELYSLYVPLLTEIYSMVLGCLNFFSKVWRNSLSKLEPFKLIHSLLFQSAFSPQAHHIAVACEPPVMVWSATSSSQADLEWWTWSVKRFGVWVASMSPLQCLHVL